MPTLNDNLLTRLDLMKIWDTTISEIQEVLEEISSNCIKLKYLQDPTADSETRRILEGTGHLLELKRDKLKLVRTDLEDILKYFPDDATLINAKYFEEYVYPYYATRFPHDLTLEQVVSNERQKYKTIIIGVKEYLYRKP